MNTSCGIRLYIIIIITWFSFDYNLVSRKTHGCQLSVRGVYWKQKKQKKEEAVCAQEWILIFPIMILRFCG